MTTPTRRRPARSRGYDPAVESDGLTLDTTCGPVDLVAVERALSGERLHLSYAEHRYVAALVAAHLAVYPSNRYKAA